MRRSVTALAIFGILGSANRSEAQSTPEIVTLNAPDGVPLKGTYFSPGKPGPALLLLHQCDGTRATWTSFASLAAAEGYHTFTFDYRGYGESGGVQFDDRQAQAALMAAKWPSDVDTAFSWLLARRGVDRERVVAAGASCGATQAAHLAERHAVVNTIVILSGGTAPAVRSFLSRAAALPVMGAASLDDGPVVSQMRALLTASSHPASKFVEFEKGGHGAEMFAVQPQLARLMLDWFRTHRTPRGPRE